jgi:hypothetical protein
MSSGEAAQRLFFVALTVLLFLLVPVLRWGLVTNFSLLTLTCACGVAALSLPALIMTGRLKENESILMGPLSVGVLMIAVLLSYLGVVGAVVVYLLAAAGLVALLHQALPVAAWKTALKAMPALLLMLILIVVQHAGTKYTSFISDALALYGRADGDVVSHAAIINAIRYFGIPSVGIDGISAIHYHIGIHYLSARMAAWSDASAIESLLALKLLMHPLSACLALSGALSLAREENVRPSGLAGIWLVTIFLCLMPFSVYWSFLSESTGLEYVVLAALLPSAFLILRRVGQQAPQPSLYWLIPAFALTLLVLPLAVAKIPGGYLWAALVGFWAMNALGWLNPRVWIMWVVLAVGLGLSVYLLTLPGEAIWRPFAALRDIHSVGDAIAFISDYFAILLAIAWLALLRRNAAAGGVLAKGSFFGPGLPSALSTAIIVLVAAMLPSMLVVLPSSNVGHFIVLEGVLALPLLVFCGAVALQRRMFHHKVIAALTALVVAFGLYTSVKNLVLDTRSAFAQQALIRTGDTTYYYEKAGRRAKRADMRRFLDAGGFAKIREGELVAGTAAPLEEQLKAFRAEFGNQAAVYAPQPVEGQSGSALWDLTNDCAGKSLFTMATAGLPMINGYPPCTPKFIYNGYAPPAKLVRLDDAEICGRATGLGFNEILIVESVDEPARNRRLSCHSFG